MRILIAEDQNLIRMGFSKILHDVGDIELEEAIDGKDAWEKFSRSPADVLLTDIVMPDMDGLSLVEKVRSVDSICKIIVISGYDRFEYAQQAMLYGVRDYLLKPVSRDTLLNIVQKRLDEFSEEQRRIDRYCETAWNGVVPDNGMVVPHDGYLLLAEASASPEDTGFSFCRRLCTLSWETAMFFSASTETSDCARSVPVTKGETFQSAIRALALRCSTQSEARKDYAIEKVTAYIARHYREPISLQSTAEAVGFHPNYLSQLFAKNMECGFVHYLQRYRIEKAKVLLRTTDKKIAEIAAETGFPDSRYFAKIFKQLEGVVPQNYRQKLCEQSLQVGIH